jgi:hypothetical protein
MLHQIALDVLPQQVSRDARLRSCSGPKQVRLELPNLVVTSSVHMDALTLHVRFLSVLGAHADPMVKSRVRAFVRLDRQSILLELSAGGATALTFDHAKRGLHEIQYGVFDGNSLLNGGIICVRV